LSIIPRPPVARSKLEFWTCGYQPRFAVAATAGHSHINLAVPPSSSFNAKPEEPLTNLKQSF
jgi:hypothetical protein